MKKKKKENYIIKDKVDSGHDQANLFVSALKTEQYVAISSSM